MFVIILTYQKDLSEVEKHLEAHRSYLDVHYKSQHFIASGAQVPRTGGVILCKAESRGEVEAIITQDPFYQNKIATYQVIEFTPTKYAEALGTLIAKS